jgi:hypothetical protein
MGIWQTIEKNVQIKQKVIKYTPVEKLQDAFINIMAGGHGVVEINNRVRPDAALSAAFGRSGCAEQSTVNETLNACTESTVKQMRTGQRRLRLNNVICVSRLFPPFKLIDFSLNGGRDPPVFAA